MNRAERAAVAAETDAIIEAGFYDAQERVTIADAIAAAKAATHIHEAHETLTHQPAQVTRTSIDVTGETTLQAAKRLTEQRRGGVACLNFASAKHPGGGYQGGSQAQEESLARSSALVATLNTVESFYQRHRNQPNPIYTDTVVCSPEVPVFRDDSGQLLDEPYQVAFITAAAPNARALRERGAVVELRPILRSRGARVLGAALHHGWAHLILGAWGCGVFGNDPADVADTFAELLTGSYRHTFQTVTFAVLDTAPSTPTLRAFEDAFSDI